MFVHPEVLHELILQGHLPAGVHNSEGQPDGLCEGDLPYITKDKGLVLS